MRPIHASGWWAEIQQAITERWRVAVGYGIDNPRDSDVSDGGRIVNQSAFANVFWDAAAKLGFAAEGSVWSTTYQALGRNSLWRADVVVFIRF
jgi:hypothetical protein